MQFKLALVTITLAAVAAAIPTGGGGGNSCNVGSVQCCNSVQSAGSPVVQTLAGLLGIALGEANVPVGLTCSPISVIGVPGNSCSAQPVCCENNNFSGIIAIGCTPINANL